MKTYLSFTLPEDREELEHAWKGAGYKAFIDEFDRTFLRVVTKYDDTSAFDELLFGGIAIKDSSNLPDLVITVIEKVREEYWRMFNERFK